MAVVHTTPELRWAVVIFCKKEKKKLHELKIASAILCHFATSASVYKKKKTWSKNVRVGNFRTGLFILLWPGCHMGETGHVRTSMYP